MYFQLVVNPLSPFQRVVIRQGQVTELFEKTQISKAPGPDGLWGRTLCFCGNHLGDSFQDVSRSLNSLSVPLSISLSLFALCLPLPVPNRFTSASQCLWTSRPNIVVRESVETMMTALTPKPLTCTGSLDLTRRWWCHTVDTRRLPGDRRLHWHADTQIVVKKGQQSLFLPWNWSFSVSQRFLLIFLLRRERAAVVYLFIYYSSSVKDKSSLGRVVFICSKVSGTARVTVRLCLTDRNWWQCHNADSVCSPTDIHVLLRQLLLPSGRLQSCFSIISL